MGGSTASAGNEEAQAIEALRDHWWVEHRTPAGWTALDPSVRSHTPGAALLSASSTFQPANMQDVGDELLHRLRIEVVVESWDGARVTETPVLSHEVQPHDVSGTGIRVTFEPVNWPPQLDLLQRTDGNADLIAAARMQREWLPVVRIGQSRVTMHRFDLTGRISDATGAAALGNSLADMLSGGSKREIGGSEPGSRHATAVWIDYSIHTPGRPPRTIRRPVFDLLGAGARAIVPVPGPPEPGAAALDRSLSLLGEIHILPVNSELTPEFVRHTLLAGMLSNRAPLSAGLACLHSGDTSALWKAAGNVVPAAPSLYDLVLARAAWSPVRSDVFIDRWNVFTHFVRIRRLPDGRLAIAKGFDIVANEVGVRQGARLSPFVTRIAQGVTDTNAEAILAAAGGSGTEHRGSDGRGTSGVDSGSHQ